jgi:hypothetical protein
MIVFTSNTMSNQLNRKVVNKFLVLLLVLSPIITYSQEDSLIKQLNIIDDGNYLTVMNYQVKKLRNDTDSIQVTNYSTAIIMMNSINNRKDFKRLLKRILDLKKYFCSVGLEVIIIGGSSGATSLNQLNIANDGKIYISNSNGCEKSKYSKKLIHKHNKFGCG